MSLGDKFSIDIKTDHAKRGTQIGAVLRLFVEDTNPPKVKYFIVVGLTQDGISLASVYINSEVNMIMNYSQELRALHLPLSADDCNFLDHDSYVDCSRLVIRDRERIYQDLLNCPEAFVGTLSQNQLTTIRNHIIGAKTIKGKIKKKFALYDHKA
jgi:hypothetical protein